MLGFTTAWADARPLGMPNGRRRCCRRAPREAGPAPCRAPAPAPLAHLDDAAKQPVNSPSHPQVHLDDYGSAEEAYLAGKRRLAATTAKIANQNAPQLINGKVRAALGAPGRGAPGRRGRSA